ncbi:hypothetical protein MKHDV_02827 [Halodesulfovibrio sp. MK-HDV]|nr:hypothetical protein MKHDV_02827 [Halodesulfovibrio sp. MK-HDV]
MGDFSSADRVFVCEKAKKRRKQANNGNKTQMAHFDLLYRS